MRWRSCVAVAVGFLSFCDCAPRPSSRSTSGGSVPQPAQLGTAGSQESSNSDRCESASIRTLDTVAFEEPVEFYITSDIGLLHVYSGKKLHTIDMLTGTRLGPGIDLPGIESGSCLSPVPATNILLISKADAKQRGQSDTAKEGPPQDKHRSYAVDVFSESILWSNTALAPSATVHPLYTVDMVALRSAESYAKSNIALRDLLGVDLLTGNIVWRKPLFARSECTSLGNVIQVDGPTASILEARSGECLWSVDGGNGFDINGSILRRRDHVCFRSSNRLKVISVPPAPDKFAKGMSYPGPIVSTGAWEQKLGELDSSQLIGNDRMLLVDGRERRLVNVDDGTVIWREKQKSDFRNLSVSPNERIAAAVGDDRLIVVDLETGKTAMECKPVVLKKGNAVTNFIRPKSRASTLTWPSNDVVAIDLYVDGQLQGISRFDIVQGRDLWCRMKDIPEPPQFRRTTAEKWRIVGQVVVSAGMVVGGAALAKNTQNLELRNQAAMLMQTGIDGFFTALANAFTSRGVTQYSGEAGALAARRYRDRVERMRQNPNERMFLSGGNDVYCFVAIDNTTGQPRTLATYEAKSVHQMFLDEPYRVAVSLEQDMHTLRILEVPGYRVPTKDLLPPKSKR